MGAGIRSGLALATLILWALTAPGAATADDAGYHQVAEGLSVYLGVVPAALVRRDHPPDHAEAEMHRGPPRGRHVQHVMIAAFDAATGDRLEDARVSARVAPVGLAGVSRRLQPMVIADTVTYGNYFTMGLDGAYRIVISVTPAERPDPARFEFTHVHRRQ